MKDSDSRVILLFGPVAGLTPHMGLYNLMNYPEVHSPPCFLSPSFNLPYIPSLFQIHKRNCKLSFQEALFSVCWDLAWRRIVCLAQRNWNKLIKILYMLRHSYVDSQKNGSNSVIITYIYWMILYLVIKLDFLINVKAVFFPFIYVLFC